MGYFSPGAYGGVPPGMYGGMMHPAALALHSILSRYGGMMHPNPGGVQGYWTPERMAQARPMNMVRPGGPLMNVGAMLPPVSGGQVPGQAPNVPGQVGGQAPPAQGQAPGTAPPGVTPSVLGPQPGGTQGYWTPARMASAQGR